EPNLLSRLLRFQKAIFSSLRLKDVLDSATQQFAEITGNGKVCIFLADNDNLSLKLMTSHGYQDVTCEQLRRLPFTGESLLKSVVQRRTSAMVRNAQEAPDISAAIMAREKSQGQIGLPLIAANLLIGCVLIDLTDAAALGMFETLGDIADLTAVAVA